MSSRRPVALLALLIALLPCRSAPAQEYSREFVSADGLAALILTQDGPTVSVGYRTVFPAEDVVVTVTFEASTPLTNLTPAVRLPYTTTVRGTQPVTVFSATIDDPARPWGAPILFWMNYGLRGARWEAGPALLPYAPSAGYRILQGHNGRLTHKGEHRHALDWDTPVGTPVAAIRDGLVVAVQEGYTQGGLAPEHWGKDNHVAVLHSDGTLARYVHMLPDGVLVEVGQRVRAGDIIALSGNTGYSDGPHLHVDVVSPVDGKERDTLAVAFRTGCSPSGEIPVEGVVYGESRCGVLDVDGIVVATGLEQDRPAGAGTRFAAGRELTLYLPIDRPGVHRLRVRITPEGGGSDLGGVWTTAEDWWFTYWTFRPAAGSWIAVVYLDDERARRLPFRVE